MSLRLRPRRAPLLLAAGIAAAALTPSVAHAAAFGAPQVISGRDDASAPQIEIAPNGRTAVVYKRYVNGRRSRNDYRVAIGPSPDRLGKPVTLTAGRRAATDPDIAPTLMARADGSFVACFPDPTRNRATVEGCSFATPTGGLGPLRAVRRLPKGAGPGTGAIMRSDGSIIMLLSTSKSSSDGRITGETQSLVTIAADGTIGPVRPFERSAAEQTASSSGVNAVALADGTIAIPSGIPIPGEKYAVHPGVRLMAPGADTFGPVIQVSPARLSGVVSLSGGRELLVRFNAAANAADDIPAIPRYAVMAANGTFPADLPVSGPAGAAVSLFGLSGGGLLGVNSILETAEGDSDCFNPIAGNVSAGNLAALGQPAAKPVTLSKKGQIALYPLTVVLDDGTVIITWENAATVNGDVRMEAAIRPAGATTFARPRVLPRLANIKTSVLAAGGNHAALAWTTGGSGPDGASHLVVSTLRAAPPYAKFTTRPRHPETACDE